jgi:hypothetical protein
LRYGVPAGTIPATDTKAVSSMAVNTTKLMAQRGKARSLPGMAALEARVAELEREVAALGGEVDKRDDALFSQAFQIVEGYIVTVWPTGDGTYIARCPTLNTSDESEDPHRAVASVKDGVRLVLETLDDLGEPRPPKDCGC